MFLWDYGSLSESEEAIIVKKIVSGINDNESLMDDKVTDHNIMHIANCVSFSQKYTRQHEAKWAVSLRDVARFQKLFCYFYKNNTLNYKPSYWYSRQSAFSAQERAFTLAICFCYYFRIQDNDLRDKFKNELQTFSLHMTYNLTRQKLENILQEEYECLLKEIEIPPGIGSNTPLKENIFVIFTCLMNKIPLFLTGKPGSSKTLALNLIMKSMKGKTSIGEFFKKLPAVLPFSYQGSLQSTSAGIKRVFDKAIKCQKRIQEKQENTIVHLQIDEIGLAEKSPNNPLKVLHSLLEPPEVAVVGISNWALDASKMNRGITLSRPDPKKRDLLESAQSINEQINQSHRQKMDFINRNFMEGLSDGYLQYIASQSMNFHGLRDFYSLIQQVCHSVEVESFSFFGYGQQREQNEQAILKAVERNFGGKDTQQIVAYFGRALNIRGFSDHFKPTPTDQLLQQNVRDQRSRHMMLIVKEEEEDEAFELVQEALKGEKKDFRFFMGSDFALDETEDAAYRLINDIILCMERGISCVLVNQSIIYQSFYDMLNQNYQVVNGQSFCRVAIGPDSTRCLVHKDFRCIVVVSEKGVKSMDPPLLNRFEKQNCRHRLNGIKEKDYLTTCVDALMAWINMLESRQGRNFSSPDLFPVDVKLSLSKLVALMDREGADAQLSELSSLADIVYTGDMTSIVESCKAKIIQMASIHGLLRSTEGQYIEDIKSRLDLHTVIREKLSEKGRSSNNLMIYTYQTTEISLLAKDAGYIDLDLVKSKRGFEEKVRELLALNPLLIVYANSMSNSLQRIKLCKTILTSQNNEEGAQDKRICFIVKLTDPKSQLEKHACTFSPLWEEIFVEVLNGRGQTSIHTSSIIENTSITEYLSTEDVALKLFQDNIAEIFCKINYQVDETELSERINQIKQALVSNGRDLKSLLVRLFQRHLQAHGEERTDWKVMVARNTFLMNSRITFHGAAYEYISKLAVKYFSFIVFLMENEGVLEALLANKHDEGVLGCFEEMCRDQQPPLIVGTGDELFAMTQLPSFSFEIPKVYNLPPFTRHLHKMIMNLYPFFMESEDEDVNKAVWDRFEAEKPAHFEGVSVDLKPFIPRLMQKEDSGPLILEFLDAYLRELDHEPTVLTDLYVGYWQMEELIKEVQLILEVLEPHICGKEQFINLLKDKRDDKDLVSFSVSAICSLMMPTQELLERCQANAIDWLAKVGEVLGMFRCAFDVDSVEKEQLEFLFDIGQRVIRPFNMNINVLKSVLDALETYDIREQPEELIEEVEAILNEDSEDQTERKIHFMRLVYQYLERRIKTAETEPQASSVARFALSRLGNDYDTLDFQDLRFQASAHSLLTTIYWKFSPEENEEASRFQELDEIDGPFFSLKELIDKFLEDLRTDCEHPVAVMLTDIMEKALPAVINPEDIYYAMDQLQGPSEDHESLRSLLSIAYFRHAAKELVQQYLFTRQEGQDALGEIGEIIQMVFSDRIVPEKPRTKPMILYIVKLLMDKNLSPEELRSPLLASLMPWLSQYHQLDSVTQDLCIGETVDIGSKESDEKLVNLYSLLRRQGELDIDSFKQFISAPERQSEPQSQILNLVLQSMPTQVENLKPLLDWVVYVKRHFHQVVSKRNATDKSIDQVIEEYLPESEKSLARQLADEFANAWNRLEITRGHNVDCLSTKFINCCITGGDPLSQTLKRLAQTQNEFLARLQMPFKKVNLLQLKPEQILGFGDFDLNGLVNSRGHTHLLYGNGIKTYYDIDRIFEEIKETLLLPLAQISYDELIPFEFGAHADESDPFTQYKDIQNKVGKQERCFDTRHLLHLVQSNEDRKLLLSQIRLTMSFLQKTGGDREKSLAQYMLAQNIDKSLRKIQEFSSFRLKHVLDIFERVEEALHRDLIEKTHPKYREEIKGEGHFQRLNEADLYSLKGAVGRLCVRQLSTSNNLNQNDDLFDTLMKEENAYLFGITGEPAPRMQRLQGIRLSQAYSAFKAMVKVEEAREQEKFDQHERRKRIDEANARRIQYEQEQARQEMHGGVVTSQLTSNNLPTIEEESTGVSSHTEV